MKKNNKLKRTITTIFMMPTLKIDKENLINNGFLDAFSRDDISNFEYQDSIYLLFLPPDLRLFEEFLEREYKRSPQVIADYDLPNNFIVVVYQLEKEYKENFDLIRKGKYSETSEEFQSKFPRIVKIRSGNRVRNEISLQYRIFNKTADLIEFWEKKMGILLAPEQELWQMFEEQKPKKFNDEQRENSKANN